MVTLFFYCLCYHGYTILFLLILPWLRYFVAVQVAMVMLFCYCSGCHGYAILLLFRLPWLRKVHYSQCGSHGDAEVQRPGTADDTSRGGVWASS